MKKNKTFLNNKRMLQITFFNDIIDFNNIRFTSPYFQILSGQEENAIAIRSIGRNEFIRISRNPNVKEIIKKYFKDNIENEYLLIGRDNHGELKGSINIRPNNEVRVCYTDPNLQKSIIAKNIKRRKNASSNLFLDE